MDERFAPFERHDVAVTSSAYELVRTVLMTPLAPLRALWMVCWLAWYSGVCWLALRGVDDTPAGRALLQTGWRSWLLWTGHLAAKIALLGSLGMWVHVTPDSDWGTRDANGERAQVRCCLFVVGGLPLTAGRRRSG